MRAGLVAVCVVALLTSACEGDNESGGTNEVCPDSSNNPDEGVYADKIVGQVPYRHEELTNEFKPSSTLLSPGSGPLLMCVIWRRHIRWHWA